MALAKRLPRTASKMPSVSFILLHIFFFFVELGLNDQLSNFTLEFTNNTRTNFSILTIDDNSIVQGSSSLTLRIRQSDEYTLGNFSSYNVAIWDNNSKLYFCEWWRLCSLKTSLLVHENNYECTDE